MIYLYGGRAQIDYDGEPVYERVDDTMPVLRWRAHIVYDGEPVYERVDDTMQV